MRYLITLAALLATLVSCVPTQVIEAKRVTPLKKSEPPSVSAEEKAGDMPKLRPLMPRIPLVKATVPIEEKKTP